MVPDWQFSIAYNAALQLSCAALAAAGFRAERASHHYRVIHSLRFTIGLDAATISKFDLLRKKRNITGYDRADAVSQTEADGMRQLAEALRAQVEAWIRDNYPQLAP